MGRIYKISAEVGSLTSAAPLLYIKSAATAVVWVHELLIHQEDVTADDNMVMQINKATNDATGGVTLTAAGSPDIGGIEKQFTLDPAFAGVVVSEPTGGALLGGVMWREPASVLAGIFKIWTPETRLFLGPSERLVLRSDINISAATFTIDMTIEEIG